MRNEHLAAIRSFEGFTEVARPDYGQASNGYGTRARYVGEVVSKAEAERRFQDEIAAAQRAVQRFHPVADEGTAAALTSLTFNAGVAWMRDGLGAAVKAGDLDTARNIFKQYVHAGGSVLPGLVARREVEASWFGGTNWAADSKEHSIAVVEASRSALMTAPSLQNGKPVAAGDLAPVLPISSGLTALDRLFCSLACLVTDALGTGQSSLLHSGESRQPGQHQQEGDHTPG